MKTNLKKDNHLSIFYILMFTILIAASFQLGFEKWPDWSEAAITGTCSVLFSATLVMITNFLPQSIKHKLLFFRWKDELPGCRCHELAQHDLRIDTESAQLVWPELFDSKTNGNKRNAIWYRKIYQPQREVPEVQHAHQQFLLYRDVFSGLVVIFILTLLWRFWGDVTLVGELKTSVFIVLSVGLVISLFAAQSNGNRFVANAMSAALVNNEEDKSEN